MSSKEAIILAQCGINPFFRPLKSQPLKLGLKLSKMTQNGDILAIKLDFSTGRKIVQTPHCGRAFSKPFFKQKAGSQTLFS